MTSKFNVLVVDDEPDKRQLLAFALEMEGYEVRTAEDGVEGLAEVAASQPDLIVTDVMMPRMDGYEMIRRVRSDPRTRFIPVVIQSAARVNGQDVRLGSEVGAMGYLTDPTDLDLLRARVRTLLEFKRYLDSCEEAAFTDHLTGLANRRRFERQLEREVARTERYGHPFCLLLIDLDDFKQVNDTFGHDAGDEALRRVGGAIQSGTRGIDTGARIGGDEFAVILPETDFARGLEVAERLRAAIGAMEVEPVGRVSASFGLAELPVCARDRAALREAADAALYEAKRAGRDRVAGAPPLPAPNQTGAPGVHETVDGGQ
ncbi:MAG TPA: diguanylate cyclase [Pyrinomonadaceae bacterium]|nr:diguanylate cyclase [Pyrinomonadaceae bacterium]